MEFKTKIVGLVLSAFLFCYTKDRVLLKNQIPFLFFLLLFLKTSDNCTPIHHKLYLDLKMSKLLFFFFSFLLFSSQRGQILIREVGFAVLSENWMIDLFHKMYRVRETNRTYCTFVYKYICIYVYICTYRLI